MCSRTDRPAAGDTKKMRACFYNGWLPLCAGTACGDNKVISFSRPGATGRMRGILAGTYRLRPNGYSDTIIFQMSKVQVYALVQIGYWYEVSWPTCMTLDVFIVRYR